jgi:probable F420-dependent oxidoreductase
MKIGVSMFATDTSANPATVARRAEEMGFDSFWVSEHSHMPLSTDFPLADTVPREYASMLDPFVALAAAASVTDVIKLGTAIVILPQRDPINCAKAVASIDHLSNGRMQFGIGAGWNEPEMRNHGTDPARRFKLMRERVEAMQALWSRDEAEYHGEFVDFDPVWQWPKPIQKPHPPILIAGAGPNVVNRVVRYGDGWLPVVIPEATEFSQGRMTPMDEFATSVAQMRKLAAEAGRPRPQVVASSVDMSPGTLQKLRELEVDTVLCRLTPGDLDTVTKELAAHAKLL